MCARDVCCYIGIFWNIYTGIRSFQDCCSSCIVLKGVLAYACVMERMKARAAHAQPLYKLEEDVLYGECPAQTHSQAVDRTGVLAQEGCFIDQCYACKCVYALIASQGLLEREDGVRSLHARLS